MHHHLWRLAPALALTFASCAHAKIPNTEIDDTSENREVIEVVKAYQRAVEERNARAVLDLVSPAYFEDNGNTDATDDYDFEGLKSSLESDFARTKTLKLEVRVDAVKVNDDDAYAELYYRYHAQNDYPSGLKWNSGSDRTRLRMKRTGGRWLIVAGL